VPDVNDTLTLKKRELLFELIAQAFVSVGIEKEYARQFRLLLSSRCGRCFRMISTHALQIHNATYAGSINPISTRNRDGDFFHPRYLSAPLKIRHSFARVIATKQFRRSSSISALVSPFCLLWKDGKMSSANP